MAKSQSRSDFRNVILSRLSPERLESLRPHLQPVELEVKQDIYQPNRPIKDAYFVETGMISVVSIMEDGRSIEVGTIGREGVAGAVHTTWGENRTLSLLRSDCRSRLPR